MTLRRYWFEFAVNRALPPGVRLGCGVTAYGLDDATQLLRERVCGGETPPIVVVVEDVDVSRLDSGHVLPNMHPPTHRGVWFPMGYS
jgi:hypothetical protein